MKKWLSLALTLALVLSLAACGSSNAPADASTPAESSPAESSSAGEETKDWAPTKTVNWDLTVNPGGGNDIFTRSIIDIFGTEGITDANFVVNYKTDGSGEIARMDLAKNDDPHVLLGYTSGDLTSMVGAGNNTLDDFKFLTVLCSDKHILLVNQNGKYQSVEEIVAANKAGEVISFGGAKGDDEILFNMVAESLGLDVTKCPYVPHGSNADSLTALLGNQIDVCVSKLAACKEYLNAGEMNAIAALSTEPFTAAPFDAAPTLSQLGYENVELPIWRAIVMSAKAPQEAVDYYIDCLKQLSETDAWAEYIASNLSSPMNLFGADADAYVREFKANLGL